MKKGLLFIIGLLTVLSLKSQELVIKDTLGNQINNDTLFIEAADTIYEMVGYVHVTNTTGQLVNVSCKKEIVSEVSGSANYFCWAGNCFPPSTYISTGAEPIQAGGTSEEFSGHYQSAGFIGTTVIRYVFFVSHPDLSDTVYVSYTAFHPVEEKLIITDNLGNELTNDTLYVSGADTLSEIVGYLNIINTSANSFDVLVKKVVITDLAGTYNYFSWAGSSYGPATFISTNSEAMSPGDTSDTFSCHYMPNNLAGNILVKYIFYAEQSVLSDTVFVSFTSNSVGSVGEISSIMSQQPYPNPSSDVVYFTFDPNKVNATVKLNVYNLMGELVEQHAIAEPRFGLNLNKLSTGVYVYSIVDQSQVFDTGRIVVR